MRGVRSAFKALKIASPQWWQRAQLVSNFAESRGVTDLFVSCSGPFEKLGTRTHVSGNCWVRLSWRKEGRPPSPRERTGKRGRPEYLYGVGDFSHVTHTPSLTTVPYIGGEDDPAWGLRPEVIG